MAHEISFMHNYSRSIHCCVWHRKERVLLLRAACCSCARARRVDSFFPRELAFLTTIFIHACSTFYILQISSMMTSESSSRTFKFSTLDDDDETNDVDEHDDKAPTSSEQEGNAYAKATSMALHERNRLEFVVIVVGGTALSFNSGFINGCTLQFRGIAVSHMTGTISHAGIFLGNHDWDNLLINLCLVTCFIFGSAISGAYMPQRSFHLGLQYGPLFLIGSGLLMTACLTSLFWPNTNYYFYLAAMASGLQNALTSKYSGNIIRTTHMTGTSTDIGIVLGRICMGDTSEAWKLAVLTPIAVAFLAGGAISVESFRRLGNLSLMINVVVFFCIGLLYSIVVGYSLHIPFWQASLGLYEKTEATIKSSTKAAKKIFIKGARAIKSSSTSSQKNDATAPPPPQTLNPIHTF
jgi:uncharacterized membrane protein YoaK (UPF0700 family)